MIGLLIARLLAGRLARWAVPAIVLELLVGFALGNTLLPFASIAPLSGLTELGVLTLFFQVGMEVRSDLLSASAFTILRLVGLSCLTPLLAFWPLTHGFAMAAPTAWLCLAVLSATGTGVTLRLLSQRSALRTPLRPIVGGGIGAGRPARHRPAQPGNGQWRLLPGQGQPGWTIPVAGAVSRSGELLVERLVGPPAT